MMKSKYCSPPDIEKIVTKHYTKWLQECTSSYSTKTTDKIIKEAILDYRQKILNELVKLEEEFQFDTKPIIEIVGK